MSRFSRVGTRGASVLAALVLAAFLASIALVVQQGSPIAYTQSQTGEVGTAISSPTEGTLDPSQQTQTEVSCEPTYDYLVDISGSKPTITKEHVCYTTGKATTNGTKKYPENPGASDWDTDGGRCVLTPNVGYQAGADWRCIIKSCKTDPAGQRSCFYAYADKGVASANEGTPDATGYTPDEKEALAAGAAAGDPDSIKQAKELLKADPAFQGVLNGAFEDQEQQLSNQYNAADDTLTRLGDLAGQCSSGGGGADCTEYQQAQAAKASAQQGLQDLTNNYADLADSEKTLGPACASTGGDCTTTTPPPDKTTPPPGTTNPPPKTNPNTFPPQQPPPQLPPSSAPPASGAPQSPFGGACQQRYVCSGNTLYYQSAVSNGVSNQCQTQPVQQCQYGCMQPYGATGQSSTLSIVSGITSILSAFGGGSTGVVNNNLSSSCATQQQQQSPYGTGTDGQQCQQPPQQPDPAQCTVGSWRPTSATGNGCITGYQCVPNGSGGTGTQPTAQLSCQPLSTISGTTVSLSYACAGGATNAAATGFSIPSATALSGNATTTVLKPAGGNSVTYSLSCANANAAPAATASAQCTVQVGNASIVLVATPDRVSQAETDTTKKQSTIGWVTSGMQACTIADGDFSDWTSQQAGNTSVAGAATSPVIATTTTFTLSCTTLAGTTASSSVQVLSTQ